MIYALCPQLRVLISIVTDLEFLEFTQYAAIYYGLEQFYVYENEKKIDLGTMNYPEDFLTCATVDGDEVYCDWPDVYPTKGNRVLIQPDSYEFFHNSKNVTHSYKETYKYATLIYE